MELYNKTFKVDSVEEIDEAFRTEYVYEMVEQNTTDYYADASDTIKIGDKYYEVTVEFEMIGAWQDVGDKLYTIDEVTDVSYVEVSKESLINRLNSAIDFKVDRLYSEIAKLKSQRICNGGDYSDL